MNHLSAVPGMQNIICISQLGPQIQKQKRRLFCRYFEEARRLNLSFIELSATKDGLLLYKKLGFTEKKSKYTSMILQLD